MFLTYINAYQGTPSLTELKQAVLHLQTQVEDAELTLRLGNFHPDFLRFIESGDITFLAPDGTMSPEVFEATKSYVFCVIEYVSGRTVLARYLSGKNFTGVIPAELPIRTEVVIGPCIVRHEHNQIVDWLQLDKSSLSTLGVTFNQVAAKSKVKK